MSARVWLGIVLVSLVGGLVLALVTIGEYRSEREQYDAAIIHLNDTIKQERARHDETDKQLAETARDRNWLEQEADALAKQLAKANTDNDCVNTVIPGAIAVSVHQYRDSSASYTGAGTEDMDRSVTTSGYRPTFGEYIASAEQFFQQCNADRVKVGEWSRQGEQ